MLILEKYASATATVAGYTTAVAVILSGFALGALWILELL